MSVWSVKVINSMAHIVSEGTADSLDYDFLTGDFSPTIPASSSAFLFGATLGTTLSATATAPTDTLFVTSAAGAVIGEWCAVVLDDGTQYYAVVTDILATIITLSRDIPSDATSGNQVVFQSQLSGATDFTTTEDFKFSKANEIIANTINLRTAEVLYENTGFVPTDSLIGDAAAYLTTGRAADQFNAVTGLGLSRTFVDEEDLADFTYTIAGYVDNLTSGQGSLIDQVYDADNTQLAMDAIVDNRDTTPPTLTDPYLPFVRFTSDDKSTVRVFPPSNTQVCAYQLRDFADTTTFVSLEFNDLNDTSGLRCLSPLEITSSGQIQLASTGTTLATDFILLESAITDGLVARFRANPVGSDTSTDVFVLDATTPEGNVTSDPGGLAFNVDTTADILLKRTGAGDTGWRSLVGGPSVIMFGDATLQQTTATRYLTPGYDAGGTPTVAIRYPVPRDGVIEDMRVSCRIAGGNGNNVVYTLRVNSVASALAVTLASDTLDGSATGSVPVSAGDIIDIEVTKAAAIGSSLSDVICTMSLY